MKILMIILVLALSGCVDRSVSKEAIDNGTLMCAQNGGLYSIARYTNVFKYVVICKNNATFENVEGK